MAGGKETPRQKMIGMMYLVLTALLALNVSKEILDAFMLVDNGLLVTESSISVQNAATMVEFEGKYNANPEKTKPFLDEAKKISAQSDELIAYIEELKARTITVSMKGNSIKYGEGFEKYMVNGKSVNLASVDENGNKIIKKPDENQEVTALLVGAKPESPKDGPWTATELKEKLEAFREDLKNITVKEANGTTWTVPTTLVNSFDQIFSYPDEVEQDLTVSWQAKNFYHNPIAAMLPIMTKLQLDVRNAKSDILSAMISGIEGKSYKFTTLKPMVIPESNFVLRGDTFKAQIFLAAYDATNAPDIYIDKTIWDGKDQTLYQKKANDNPLKLDANGFGILSIPANSTGDFQYKGRIDYKGPSGDIVEYSVIIPPYQVREPNLVVSPTKMNVFYRGLENPVEISVPGYASDRIDASCPGHNLVRRGNEWIIKPGQGKEANISVSVRDDDGSTRRMGTKEFRVKRIPDPTPSFAGKSPSDNTIPKNEMVIAAGIRAQMDNFDFDVNVVVKSFKMVVIRDGQVIEKSSNSNRVTEEMKANMSKVRKGEKIYIENIMVEMPDKTTRQVSNISLRVT